MFQDIILCNFQKKTDEPNSTWKNDKNLTLDPILAYLAQFFLQVLLLLGIVPSCHPTQFKQQLMNQTWEIGKKPNFKPNFDPNLQPHPHPHLLFFWGFFVGFTSSTS